MNRTKAKQRVLVVDDKRRVVDLVRAFLEAEGYEVLATNAPREALRLAREERPDLILTDIEMPAMDGYDLCLELKRDERTHTIPVIFVTGKEEKEGSLTSFLAGGDDYLTKPIERPQLLLKIRRFLAGVAPADLEEAPGT